MVTFVDSGVSVGSPAGVFPSSQDSIVQTAQAVITVLCSSGVSGDLPVSASGDITNAVSVDSGSVGGGELIQQLTQLVQLWLLHRLGLCQLRAFLLFLLTVVRVSNP